MFDGCIDVFQKLHPPPESLVCVISDVVIRDETNDGALLLEYIFFQKKTPGNKTKWGR